MQPAAQTREAHDELAAQRRQNAAHGASRGKNGEKSQPSPGGAKEASPRLPLIVGHVVLFQKSYEFLLKREFLVVFLLVRDVSGDGRYIGFADVGAMLQRRNASNP